MSQSKTPVQNVRNIPREISFADLDFHVFVNCGRKAMVVNVPAKSPISVIISMLTSGDVEKDRQLRSRLGTIPAASPSRRRAQTWCDLFVAPCALNVPPRERARLGALGVGGR